MVPLVVPSFRFGNVILALPGARRQDCRLGRCSVPAGDTVTVACADAEATNRASLIGAQVRLLLLLLLLFQLPDTRGFVFVQLGRPD